MVNTVEELFTVQRGAGRPPRGWPPNLLPSKTLAAAWSGLAATLKRSCLQGFHQRTHRLHVSHAPMLHVRRQPALATERENVWCAQPRSSQRTRSGGELSAPSQGTHTGVRRTHPQGDATSPVACQGPCCTVGDLACQGWLPGAGRVLLATHGCTCTW